MILGHALFLSLLPVPCPPSLPQQAQSLFDAATVQLIPVAAPFRRVADLDLDGDPDAVGVTLKSDNRFYRLYGYRNDGQGVFTTQFVGEQGISPTSPGKLLIELGHLNADAWPDACVVYATELDN